MTENATTEEIYNLKLNFKLNLKSLKLNDSHIDLADAALSFGIIFILPCLLSTL